MESLPWWRDFVLKNNSSNKSMNQKLNHNFFLQHFLLFYLYSIYYMVIRNSYIQMIPDNYKTFDIFTDFKFQISTDHQHEEHTLNSQRKEGKKFSNSIDRNDWNSQWNCSNFFHDQLIMIFSMLKPTNLQNPS